LRIAVVYDFGINRGGGDFVMLSILEALDHARHDVTLETSKPKGFNQAKEIFQKQLDRTETNVISLPNWVPHPYSIAFMAKKISGKKYDLMILSDDIPKCLSDARVISYVHYPHIARLVFRDYVVQRHARTLRGRLAFHIHKRIFPIFYPNKHASDKWFFIANSMVTKTHLSEALNLGPEKTALLHPSVASASITALLNRKAASKENLAVCIGRFEPNKRSEDVVYALSLLGAKTEIRVSLVGFGSDRAYLDGLIETIRSLGLEERVELVLNAGRDVVLDRLFKAKVLVHSAIHEPFGIAVAEGMAARCIPIVRRGENGPWLEITEKGKYGLNFETVEELASAVEKAIGEYYSFDTDEIASKALEFDERRFEGSFLELMQLSLAEN
jgi:glycosyltransferase involved in cell wall biosynthesis